MAKYFDDGGLFDKLVREADDAANGDQGLKLSLLTNRILQDFMNFHMPSGRNENGCLTNVVDKLGSFIPRRRRGEEPRTATAVSKKGLKRCFDQTQNSIAEEEQVVRNPPKMLKKTKRRKNKFCFPLPQIGLPTVVLPHPQISLQAFGDYIQSKNGTDMMLVMEKDITESDLSKQHNRLSIPRNKIKADFLSPEEHHTLNAKQGINVLLVQPCLEDIRLELKMWTMNNTYCYNLIGSWYKGVVLNDSNNLVKGCTVQLWRFRRDSELCFALMKM